MRKSPWVAAVWTLNPNSFRAVLAASSHSGVEKASSAGLSVALINSNWVGIGYLSLSFAGCAVAAVAAGLAGPSGNFIRRWLIVVVDSPRDFLIKSMPRVTGPRLV